MPQSTGDGSLGGHHHALRNCRSVSLLGSSSGPWQSPTEEHGMRARQSGGSVALEGLLFHPLESELKRIPLERECRNSSRSHHYSPMEIARDDDAAHWLVILFGHGSHVDEYLG